MAEKWYETHSNIASVAGHMAGKGATGAEVAAMVEKPWNYDDEWYDFEVEIEAGKQLIEDRAVAALAGGARALLTEYDETMATPLQDADIAEIDLRDGLLRLLGEST